MKRYLFLCVLIFFSIVPLLQAQEKESEFKELPGYVDFSSLTEFQNAKTTVEVYLKEPLLSLIAAAADSELAQVLSSLKLISVKNFSLDAKSFANVKLETQKITKKLSRQNWEVVVSVKEPEEQTDIYMKTVKEKVAGMVIISLDSKREATFVNIVGNIDMNSLAKLSSKFDIPKLDSIKTHHR